MMASRHDGTADVQAAVDGLVSEDRVRVLSGLSWPTVASPTWSNSSSCCGIKARSSPQRLFIRQLLGGASCELVRLRLTQLALPVRFKGAGDSAKPGHPFGSVTNEL